MWDIQLILDQGAWDRMRDAPAAEAYEVGAVHVAGLGTWTGVGIRFKGFFGSLRICACRTAEALPSLWRPSRPVAPSPLSARSRRHCARQRSLAGLLNWVACKKLSYKVGGARDHRRQTTLARDRCRSDGPAFALARRSSSSTT